MTTNILIVGNGFDLSHYLPTKYDHFMDVMNTIETHLGDTISFDKLFSEFREYCFIGKTKKYYKTGNITLEKEQLNEIRELLRENCWYKYFKNHLDIDTWIDFENQIEKLLNEFADFLNSNKGNFTPIANDLSKKLKFFQLFTKEVENKTYSKGLEAGTRTKQNIKISINSQFCFRENVQNGFNPASFLDHIYKQLEDFIEIFNLYLKLIVDKLEPESIFVISTQNWEQPNHIFSFNYTDTFQKIYGKVTTEFLHGRFGEKQNIVLGISDLEDEPLKNLKAYGFTKYQQKLFKETDYLFLDTSSKLIKKIGVYRNPLFNDGVVFHIWGHSLDKSDKDYINDLFSFDQRKGIPVKVIVYYFDPSAKFSLLNNLLAILGKDKVEEWMKNEWLKFEPNPEIDFGIQENSDIQEAS